ncbi:MAG: ferritin family protein [Bacteroidota bacterium]|nr:ferritin family protein [Bacteroidota bacterium]
MIIKDFLHYAVKEEEKAYNFYMNLSKKTTDFRTKNFLEQISRDEMKHKAIFQSFIEKNDKEFEMACSYNITFPSPEKEPDHEISDIPTIIRFAINKEIESNQMYLELAKNITNPHIRNQLLLFAEEEEKHKAGLELELEFYKKELY